MKLGELFDLGMHPKFKDSALLSVVQICEHALDNPTILCSLPGFLRPNLLCWSEESICTELCQVLLYYITLNLFKTS